MKRWFLVSCLAVVCALPAGGIHAGVMFSDGFEAYQQGGHPGGGWVPIYNALSDPSNNKVTDLQASEGVNSLQVYGSPYGSWTAMYYYPMTFPNTFYVETDLMNSGEVLTAGGNPHEGALGLVTYFYGDWGGWTPLLITAKSNADLYGVCGMFPIAEAEPMRWYRVRMKVVLDQGTVEYWVDGTYAGQQSCQKLKDNAANFKYLDLDVGSGRAWFDRLKVYEGAVPAQVDIDPDSLNIGSNGKWITAYINVPLYEAGQIAIPTVRLATPSGVRIAVDPAAPYAVMDNNGDGIPELMVKFSRSAVSSALGPTGGGGPVAETQSVLTITGEFTDGTLFEGTDSVRVIP